MPAACWKASPPICASTGPGPFICRNMAAAILRALQAKVMITENGRRRSVMKFDVAMMQLVNKAASGDLRAVNLVAMLARMAEERVEQDQSQKPGFEETDQWVLEGLMRRLEATTQGESHDETDAERKED